MQHSLFLINIVFFFILENITIFQYRFYVRKYFEKFGIFLNLHKQGI